MFSIPEAFHFNGSHQGLSKLVARLVHQVLIWNQRQQVPRSSSRMRDHGDTAFIDT